MQILSNPISALNVIESPKCLHFKGSRGRGTRWWRQIKSGNGNMAVLCMRSASGHKYRNSSVIVNLAMGQIPRSTERTFSLRDLLDSTLILCEYAYLILCNYLAAFSNAGGSKLSDVENDAKFRTFWPLPLWKLGEGWERSLYQLLKLYLRPNLRNTFDGHLLRGCWARWIDKKEKKVHF